MRDPLGRMSNINEVKIMAIQNASKFRNSLLYMSLLVLNGGFALNPIKPIDPPALRPIGDATNWMLEEPMHYYVGNSRDHIVVPKGFVTDFASVPGLLQSFISMVGPQMLPAIVHDYLYWEQTCTRKQADSIFSLAMSEMRVPRRERKAMVNAVRIFGGTAWRTNRKERNSGLIRIVPAADVRPPHALETWGEYRSFLRSAGTVSPPRSAIENVFCLHGGQS